MATMIGQMIGASVVVWYLYFRKKESLSNYKKIFYSLLVGILWIVLFFIIGIVYGIIDSVN